MNTMRSLLDLFEKRVVLDDDRNMVVSENPSHEELVKLLQKYKELRGGATKNGSLYVWDANEWVHGTIHKYVGHLEYYLYFSTTKNVSADEWKKYMKRINGIWVGIKYEQYNEVTKRDEFRPDIVLEHPRLRRVLVL